MKVVTGDFFKGAMILSGLASGLCLVCVYKTLRSFTTHLIASLTLLAIAVNANFLKYSFTAGTDMLFVGLSFASLALLLIPRQITLKHGVFAGLLVAVAYLTRYNGIVQVVFLGVILFIKSRKSSERLARYRPLLGYIVAASVLIVPWGIYCLNEKGAFFYNRGYFNIAYEMFGRGRVESYNFARFEGDQYRNFGSVFFAHPLTLTGRLFTNFFSHLFHDLGFSTIPTVSPQFPRALNQLMSIPFGILALLGIGQSLKKIPRKSEGWWVLSAVVSFLFFLFLPYLPRYAIFLVPLYCYLAITGLCQTTWFAHKVLNYPLWKWILSVALLITVIESVIAIRFDLEMLPRTLLSLRPDMFGDRHVFTESDRIACQKPQVAFLLGATWVPLPFVDNYGDLLLQLNKENADYLFFSMYEAAFRPKLAPLKDGRFATRDLYPVATSHKPDATIYLYSHHLDDLVLSRLHFDAQLPRTTGKQTAYLDNNETTPLTIDSLHGKNTIFRFAKIEHPITIQPTFGASIDILFRPPDVGEFRDSIWVFHNGNLSPGLIICDGSAEEP